MVFFRNDRRRFNENQLKTHTLKVAKIEHLVPLGPKWPQVSILPFFVEEVYQVYRFLEFFFVVMSVCRMPNGKEDFGSEFHPMGGPNHHKVHIFG